MLYEAGCKLSPKQKARPCVTARAGFHDLGEVGYR